MFAYPISLPPFSNREDLQLTIGIFDDDTNEAINLTGTQLALQNDFTASAWTVTDGTIVTASVTPITIPAFPQGNQLSVLALTVPTGLGILAGDPITIADATGLNTMTGFVTSYASGTGALVCQIGMTFQFEIRRKRAGVNSGFSSYVPFFDSAMDCGPALSASLGNGILITDLGTIQILIPETQIRRLCGPDTYVAGMTMFDGVNTRQLMIAQLPTYSGGVTQ